MLAEQVVHVVPKLHLVSTVPARIDGFSIINGAHAPSGQGGGMTIDGVGGQGLTVSNCYIQNNTSQDGAGVLISGASVVTLSGEHIINNTATGFGTAVYACRASNVTLNQGNVITGNKAQGPAISSLSGPSGGALFIIQNTTANILNNTISNNTASQAGGGIELIAARGNHTGQHDL